MRRGKASIHYASCLPAQRGQTRPSAHEVGDRWNFNKLPLVFLSCTIVYRSDSAPNLFSETYMFLHFLAVCPSQIAALPFCLLLPVLLSLGDLGRRFPACTNLGDVFFHSLHFKMWVCRHSFRRRPTLLQPLRSKKQSA
jgi:hypothetical protein